MNLKKIYLPNKLSLSLGEISFGIFIFMKQFYFLKSGSLQIGDTFVIVSFLYLWYSKKVEIYKKDILLFIFLWFVIIINLSYFTVYNNKNFIMSTFHYIFSILVVITFRNLNVHERNKSFKNFIMSIMKLNLLIQIFIFFIGKGKYYLNVRYMGTFNDPNQLAFFIFITFVIIYILSEICEKKISNLYLIISLILIVKSASTGVILGMSIFLIFKIVGNIKKLKISNMITFINITKIIVIGLLFISIIVPNFKIIKMNFDNIVNESLLISRLKDKFNRIDVDSAEITLIEERGIDRIFKYPQYTLYGAGQGEDERFINSYHQGEIHSTIPSILFSYGIIPTIIFLWWIYININKIPISIKAIYIGLFIESFTLLNQRQPFFWMIIILGFEYQKYKIKERKDEIKCNNASI